MMPAFRTKAVRLSEETVLEIPLQINQRYYVMYMYFTSEPDTLKLFEN